MSKEYMNDGSLSENGNTDLIFMINMAFLDSGEQHQNIKQHLKH